MQINYVTDTQGYLDITFGPKWEYIPLTRNFIESFLLINVIDKQNINKIAVAASELLENAVKFSNKDGVRMTIKKNVIESKVELRVFNYSDKTKALALKEYIEKTNAIEDKLHFYIDKMKESVTRNDGKACLGIPRICYEAQAEMHCEYNENEGVVEVISLFTIK